MFLRIKSLTSTTWWPILLIALGSRAILLLIIFIFPFLMGQKLIHLNEFFENLLHYDAAWYQEIATLGYRDDQVAFFPLFPLVSKLLPLPFALSATLLNNLLFVASLGLFFAYLNDKGLQKIARSACLLLAFSPYSFYFSMPYSESLFLFLSLYLFYFAQTGQWYKVALLAPFISATRNAGVFLVFPLGLIALKKFGLRSIFKFEKKTRGAWFALFILPLGLMAYMFYLYHSTGDELAFLHIQSNWERNGLFSILQSFQNSPLKELYHSLYFLLALLCAIYLFKHHHLEGAVWLTILALLGPLTGTFASEARYVMASSPFVYLGLALFIEKNNFFNRNSYLIYCLSATLLGFFMAVWLIDGKLA